MRVMYGAAVGNAGHAAAKYGIKPTLGGHSIRDMLCKAAVKRRGPAIEPDDYEANHFERQTEARAQAENRPKQSRRDLLGGYGKVKRT